MATLKTEKDLFYNFIIDKLDSSNYFRLKNGITGRTELFNFAIALGIDNGPRIIEHKNDITRLEYAESVIYIYHSLLLKENGKVDDDMAYQLAEQYAKSGFLELKDFYEHYNEENLLLKLSSEINDMKDEILSFANQLGV